jgi:hypothetical protein
MGIVGALIVRSDCQCSCTDIEVIKHLLQEMFEIKQEVYKLRSETDSIKGNTFVLFTIDFQDYGIYKD